MTCLKAVRRILRTSGLDAIAGWGFKPTARRPRSLAARYGLPYVAFEDGFLRSVRPGGQEPALSYVCDRVGVYYDATGPSALEALIDRRAANRLRAAGDAEIVVTAIRDHGLSKYNLFDQHETNRFLRETAAGDYVLVVDQTRGDAAIVGAGADRRSFLDMVVAAVEENPDRTVLIKTHPETQLGRRLGYCDPELLRAAAAASAAVNEARRSGRLRLVTGCIQPQAIFRRVSRVYTVCSTLGVEALISGVPVTTFGRSFYSGWGVTEDRHDGVSRRSAAPLAAIVAAAYLDYTTYFSPRSRNPCGIEEVIAHLLAARVRCG